MPAKKGGGKKAKGGLVEASDDQTPELDKEELKMALSNAQEKINRLETDRDRLQQQKMSLEEVLEMQKKEQTDMYEHSLREVNARDNEISAHKETIKAVNKGREQLQEELNAEIERLKADKEQVEVALQEDIENLEAQLKELNDFKSQKMGIEREIEELRANMVSMSDAHKSELEAQTQEYTAQRDKLRSDMLRRLKRTRDELFRLTDEQLHNKMHQTIKENEKLTLELEMYARESKQLLAANQQLATENASVKRSLDLQNSTTEELIRKSQTQQANIKQLTAKVKKLEASVESQKTVNAVDQSKRVVELNETVNRQYDLILELKTEVDELKEANETMEKQLRTSKQASLAQNALQKEAKTFLLQCIEDVKAAIRVVNDAGGFTKPPYEKRGSQLLTLSASEREGVLQYLLQKMKLFDAEGDEAALHAPQPPQVTLGAAFARLSNHAAAAAPVELLPSTSGAVLPALPLSARTQPSPRPY